jgi:exodeoxyribonuclease VII large subunit
MDDQPAAALAKAPASGKSPASNIPEYTVGEISGAVKRTLESAFGRIRVRGEVTEARPYASGHIYFSLKEERSKLACVAWSSVVPRLGLLPENGTEVIATGRLTTYGDRSSYQLQVDRLEYAGIGALLARVEALRLKLLAEGLFDPARKRALPLLPRVVGVVTSESGAVLQDIRTTIERRFPRRVLLWPVPVQGFGAAERIAAAISDLSRLAPDGEPPRPDVLIVARGGGSLEDLQAFNDEAVIRAAAACPVPLISAVGHETDTTLIDYAADFRAPTPTAAAELAVPSRADLAAKLQRFGAALISCAQAALRHHAVDLQRAARGLPDLPALLGTARQRLDDRAERLRLALPGLLARKRLALDAAARALPDVRALLRDRALALGAAGARLPAAVPHLLARRGHDLALAGAGLGAALRHAVARRAALAARVLPRLSDAPLRARLREASARLGGLAGQLEALSHNAVLARGYAAVFDTKGSPVTAAEAARKAAELRVQFADGSVPVRPLGRR